MGKIVRQGVEYGGSSNSADCIKYNDTKSVKEAIDEIKASSSSNPTASSVTFNNTDTGLNATNVQDAVTEVNGKLQLKGTPKMNQMSDGRYVISCTDESLNGFSIILASTYIRFDKMTNGSAVNSVTYNIKSN